MIQHGCWSKTTGLVFRPKACRKFSSDSSARFQRVRMGASGWDSTLFEPSSRRWADSPRTEHGGRRIHFRGRVALRAAGEDMSRCVLVVDDSPDVLEAMKMVLLSARSVVLTATDGKVALTSFVMVRPRP